MPLHGLAAKKCRRGKKELDNQRLATLIIRTDPGKKYQTPKYDEQLNICLALAYFTTSYFFIKKGEEE